MFMLAIGALSIWWILDRRLRMIPPAGVFRDSHWIVRGIDLLE